MEKKLSILGVVFLVAMVAGSSALALAPMGPPTATLQQGQFRAGAEYGYSEMDLDVDGGTIEDVQSNMIFGNLGYGVMDTWEAYVRLGVANCEFDIDDYSVPVDEGEVSFSDDFEGDYEFAWGFGTKYTFWEQAEDLHWGVLFQMTWFDWDDDLSASGTIDPYDFTADLSVDMDYYSMQIAVGPTWQVSDGFCVYGGPFLHYVDGDIDLDATVDVVELGSGSESESFDVEQESEFGGFVGAQLDVSAQMKAFAEVMFTGDAWGLGIGGGWVF